MRGYVHISPDSEEEGGTTRNSSGRIVPVQLHTHTLSSSSSLNPPPPPQTCLPSLANYPVCCLSLPAACAALQEHS